MVENTLTDLEASKWVAIEDDMDLSPLKGMVASYYYISYTTIERFSSSLTPKTKMKGLLEILSSPSEYAHFPIRPGEEEVVRRLINHQRKITDPHVKANVVLQAHFYRKFVGGNLSLDQTEAARNLRERSNMFCKPPLASPARGGIATPSIRTLSPAPQKFVRNAITKSPSTVDETLRASYRGSSPALVTPTRVRSVSKIGRDESLLSRSTSVREGSNPPW